jgi:hypothetical protein
VQQYYTHDIIQNGKTVTITNWPPVFILPAVLTTICAILYWMTFREPQATSDHIGQAELRAVEIG